MKSQLLLLLAITALAIAACTSGTVGQTPSPSAQPPAPSADIPSPAAAQQPAAGKTKTLEITAKQWEFIPDTITVSKGDKVHLSIRSVDVTHGIAIPAFGVSETLQPGKVTEVEFVADQTGTFTFFCSVYCGAGHSDMQGTLVVE